MTVVAEFLEKIYGSFGLFGLIITIIIGVLSYIVFRMYRKINKNLKNGLEEVNNQLVTNISKQNELLISSINSQNDKILKHFLDNTVQEEEEHSHKLVKRMEISEQINEKLKNIMYYTHAHRTFIIEFHNSNNNLSGIPFAKYSITYEWFKAGVTPVAAIYNSVAFSSISSVIKDMSDKEAETVYYEDISEVQLKNPTLYSILQSINAVSILYNALYDEKNNMIGLLVVEYHRTPQQIPYNDIKVDSKLISSIIQQENKKL